VASAALPKIRLHCRGCRSAFFVLFRATGGMAIYSFDATKDKLAKYLSQPEFSGKRLVVPLSHPNNAELGERLEFFINRARADGDPVDIYNFWEGPASPLTDLGRFSDSAGLPPTDEQLAYASQFKNRFLLWGFGTRGRDTIMEMIDRNAHEKSPSFNSVWQLGFLRKGDLILAPTGSKVFRHFHARGLSIHTGSADQFVQNSPLDLKHVGSVTSGVGSIRLGWDVFEVESEDLDADNSVYTLASLRAFNARMDVTPEASRDAIYVDRVFPKSGILLGQGWFGVESANRTLFRWAGSDSTILAVGAPLGRCRIDLDIEPLLSSGSPPMSIKSQNAVVEPGTISGRQTVTASFISNGAPTQEIKLHSEGGLEAPPPGDTRLLKMRIFSAHGLSCS
jgi:hypothetical protein